MKINVILTGYNRPEYLAIQHNAILNQSISPNKVEIWWNKGDKQPQTMPGLYGAYCTRNYKYWGRFAMGLLQDCDFLAFFDDDTIPGRDWFKNCIQSFEQKPGIYGSAGIILNEDSYFKVEGNNVVPTHIKTGWHDQSKEIREVDFVGHSWFFPKEYLLDFWKEDPFCWETGEDMHFSYACQKYNNVKTYVPAQYTSTISGSIMPQFGADQNASYKNVRHWELRNEAVKYYIDKGWRTLANAEN